MIVVTGTRVGGMLLLSIIYCCFSYGTCTFCVCTLYIVNCHNYMHYVCET